MWKRWTSDYERRLRFNLSSRYVYLFLHSLMFNAAFWYLYETQITSISNLFFLYAITNLITVVLEIPTGALADLWGRKNTMVVGIMVCALGWLMIPMFPTIWGLIVAYVVSNVGGALLSGADEALVYDTLAELKEEEKFGWLASKYGLVIRVALMMAMAGGGYLYEIDGGLVYTATGVAGILAGLVAMLSVEPKVQTTTFSWENYVEQTKRGVRALTASKEMVMFSYMYMMIGGGTWLFLYTLRVSYISSMGLVPVTEGWINSGMQMASAVAVMLFVKKLVRTEILGWWVLLLMAVGGYGLAGLVGLPWVLGALLLVQISAQGRFTVINQFANMKIDSKIRATTLSTLNMGASVVFFVLSVVTGLMMKSGDIAQVMVFMGVVLGVLIGPVLWMYRGK